MKRNYYLKLIKYFLIFIAIQFAIFSAFFEKVSYYKYTSFINVFIFLAIFMLKCKKKN